MDWFKRLSQKLPAPRGSAEADRPAVTLRDLRITGKVFSLGMQPESADSVVPFLARWGLAHADAEQADWERHWFDGNYEAIVASPAFVRADVHASAPFWFPDFYKYMHHRVPGSRFVLMLSEPDDWFRSVVAPSGGFSSGEPDVHAKVFRREDELRWLQKNIPGFALSGRLVLHDNAAHYKAAYERHAGGIRQFFQGRMAELLFVGRHDDPASLQQLAQWLRLPGGAGPVPAAAGPGPTKLSKDILLKPAQCSRAPTAE